MTETVVFDKRSVNGTYKEVLINMSNFVEQSPQKTSIIPKYRPNVIVTVKSEGENRITYTETFGLKSIDAVMVQLGYDTISLHGAHASLWLQDVKQITGLINTDNSDENGRLNTGRIIVYKGAS